MLSLVMIAGIFFVVVLAVARGLEQGETLSAGMNLAKDQGDGRDVSEPVSSDLFTDDFLVSSNLDDDFGMGETTSMFSDDWPATSLTANGPFGLGFSETCINPATGLIMVDGCSGIDVGGNPFGVDLHDTCSFGDDCFSGFDDSGFGSGFDD